MDAATQAFIQAPLVSEGETYRLLRLPPRAIWAGAGVLAEIGTPFSALIADKDEVTLLLPESLWEPFARRLPEMEQGGEYRLITFDLVLDAELTGFLALVGRVLAEAGVPILALSAFQRDHLLVPVDRFQAAWDALAAAKERLAGG